MPRTRAKSPPRLTRDAERLIALANGLNASGSVTEDRYWEGEMSTLAARLLENGNDAPIDGALDHLYQTNVGAYDTSQECSICGARVPKSLGTRRHDCPECGLSIDRDLNAARNILNRAGVGPGLHNAVNVMRAGGNLV